MWLVFYFHWSTDFPTVRAKPAQTGATSFDGNENLSAGVLQGLHPSPHLLLLFFIKTIFRTLVLFQTILICILFPIHISMNILLSQQHIELMK